MSAAAHTPGPWRWELNERSKGLHLVGGVQMYDLTIMDFERWGMHSATVRLRDTTHDGMNIMHKLHERRDWIAPFAGRKHHFDWCADVTHPDARLIAAAPELLQALQVTVENWSSQFERQGHAAPKWAKQARAAIAKATGAQP